MNDIKLLKAIENDARVSLKELSLMLNESEEEIEKTLTRLEDEKTICGFHTVINYDKTSVENVTALIEVGATPKRDTGYDSIAEEIYKFPEVSTMYLMSGKSEFIVIIRGKTMKEVSDFVSRKLAVIEGVNRTETYFVLKQYKVEGIVLEDEEDEDTRLRIKL